MWIWMAILALLLVGCQAPTSSGPSPVAVVTASPGPNSTDLRASHGSLGASPGPAESTPEGASPTTSDECCHDAMDSAQIDPMSIFNLESAWRTQDDTAFKLSDLRGQVVCLAMVYSSCRSACPRIVEDIRLIRQGLGSSGQGRVRYVLVSLDPTVDTPARLKAWARDRKLGSDWTLLTGTPDDVLELGAVLGVKFRKVSATDYAHSNLISVLNREGVVVHRQEGLAQPPGPTIEAIQALLQ